MAYQAPGGWRLVTTSLGSQRWEIRGVRYQGCEMRAFRGLSSSCAKKGGEEWLQGCLIVRKGGRENAVIYSLSHFA